VLTHRQPLSWHIDKALQSLLNKQASAWLPEVSGSHWFCASQTWL